MLCVELGELSSEPLAVLRRIEAHLPVGYAGRFDMTAVDGRKRLNASAAGGGPGPEPTEADLRWMAERYRVHNERLFGLVGRRFPWHEKPPYTAASDGQ